MVKITEPCVDCICFPMCVNQSIIRCSILYKYVSTKINMRGEFLKPEHFPNVVSVWEG